MFAQEFKGCREMVSVLNEAVQAASTAEITHNVQQGLTQLIESRSLQLPQDLKRPREDHYARRLLYRSPEHGYEVIAMVWGPGQGTPLHDHAGIWCVDGVIEGCVDVTQFDLIEEQGNRLRFAPQTTVRAGVGMTGALIPPFEYHTIFNHSSDRSSITIHVYGGTMDHCTIFEPLDKGWFRRASRQMKYSN